MMRRRIALAILVAAILTGCSFFVDDPIVGDPVIDGWPVGPEASCAQDQGCPVLLDTATIGLSRRDPGHPAIVAVTLHREGTLLDANGNQILMKRSGGCCSVARFELADGSVKAIGVGYPGISDTPMAFDYGP
jgi:hypothetical protein